MHLVCTFPRPFSFSSQTVYETATLHPVNNRSQSTQVSEASAMATGQAGSLLRHLGKAASLGIGGGLSDRQLLERFLADHDEAAFAGLVRRHGPLVLGVCHRVLGNVHDAEDAFQATFVVLLRKAAAIGRRELLANWLYGVAYRTALEAKTAAARRRAKERQVGAMPRPDAADEEVWRELRPYLDQELSRLPDKYRVPVLLCDLEGKTRKEAARQLGWPEGTLSGRLSRARALLAKRLTRHGLALSAGAVAVALAGGGASAGVPAPLVRNTVRTATLIAAGQTAATGAVSAQVAALTEGVLKAMLLTRLRIALVVLLGTALLASGVGVITHLVRAEGSPGDDRESPKQATSKTAAAPARQPRADGQEFETAPGYSWAVSPRRGRGSPWAVGWGPAHPPGPGGIVAIEEKDKDGALVITLSYQATVNKAGLANYRPVAFDARRKRYPLKKLYGASAGDVAMYRYVLDAKALPAEKAEFLGVEALTPDGPKVIARQAAERAAKGGIEVPSFPQLGKAYNFVLTTTDGKKLHSRDLRGKVVLIDCWATWCGPCMALLPEIKELYEKCHKDGLEVVGFNFDEEAEKVKRTCKVLGLAWPQVLVPKDEEARQLWQEAAGIGGLPRVLVIDREGILRADNPAKPEESVARLLKGASGGTRNESP
jgi:RNA polymerase sigma factor (sigma-70 family)